MTATIFELPYPTPEFQRLMFCLGENFPAPVTAALLRVAALDGEFTLGDAREVWATHEYDDLPSGWNERFSDAVQIVTGGSSAICCDYCAEWEWGDDTRTVRGGEIVCDDCISEHYTECYACDQYVIDENTTEIEEHSYCTRCRENYCFYCDHCEEYYRYSSHDHDDDSCECEAPHMEFQFPANGDGTIGNDERLNVELPAGTIDDAGMNTIRSLLYDIAGHYEVNRALDAVGDQWHGDKGNFTRRLSREFYNTFRVKIPADVLTEVGNRARQHSSDTSTWAVEFTRDLNLPADEFAHAESCWWGSYSQSRCALKNWGGLGMRVFGRYGVEGRAWVQPLNKDLAPTHDTLGAHAYLVFNCYGELSGAKAARIVGHLTGRTYCKVKYAADAQYVNSGGWLIADEATCVDKPDVYIGADPHNSHDATTINIDREVAA